jgi:glutamate-1-semialdehyde aminotransferase
MTMLLRAALILGGLFYLAIGTAFLFDPVRLGASFGVEAAGAEGLSSLRADFTAFFWVVGGSLAWGGWRGRGGVLIVAAALIGIALAGRGLSLLLDGSYPAAFQPMAVEALTLVLSLVGMRVLRD